MANTPSQLVSLKNYSKYKLSQCLEHHSCKTTMSSILPIHPEMRADPHNSNLNSTALISILIFGHRIASFLHTLYWYLQNSASHTPLLSFLTTALYRYAPYLTPKRNLPICSVGIAILKLKMRVDFDL